MMALENLDTETDKGLLSPGAHGDEENAKWRKVKEEVERKENDHEGVPVDTGWAWVICICIFLNITTIMGFNRTLSVIFVDIVEEFRQSATVITLMFTIHALFGSIASVVVSNIVMNKFSVRTIAVAASILNALTSIFLSLAPSITIFLLLFILKGVAFGTLLVSPMSLIGFYFKKRRSLASSIASAGICVAFIAFPLITEVLRLEYGLRGCLLVIAAIELHLVASSMFLRPVSSYKKMYTSRMKKELEEALSITPIYKVQENDSSRYRITGTGDGHSKIVIKQANGQPDTSARPLPVSDPPVQEQEVSTSYGGEHQCLLEIPYKTGGDAGPSDEENVFRQRSNSDSRHTKKLSDNGHLTGGQHTGGQLTGGHASKTAHGFPAVFSSLKNLDISAKVEFAPTEKRGRRHHVSQLSVISIEELPYIPAQEDDYSTSDQISQDRNKSKCFLKTLIDFSLFKIWLFRMMAIFVPLGAFSNYLWIYMPTIAVTSGIDKSEAALLITLVGAMDLATRIVTGFIGDFKFVSKSKMVAFSTFVLSVVCHCARLFTTYTLFIVFAVLVGMFGGFRQNFFNVMLIEYVGVENIAKAHGFCVMFGTLVMSINHPVLGAMFDATGSFIIPLHYIGIMVFLATLVLLCEPFFHKKDKERTAKLQLEEDVCGHANDTETAVERIVVDKKGSKS